ncbi:MAG TPA: hypothetical protein VHB73_05825 [Alphaproteobacteria bacterium]|nr:hypothetical protein [Alphaproteobacteria bacterium]
MKKSVSTLALGLAGLTLLAACGAYNPDQLHRGEVVWVRPGAPSVWVYQERRYYDEDGVPYYKVEPRHRHRHHGMKAKAKPMKEEPKKEEPKKEDMKKDSKKSEKDAPASKDSGKKD